MSIRTKEGRELLCEVTLHWGAYKAEIIEIVDRNNQIYSLVARCEHKHRTRPRARLCSYKLLEQVRKEEAYR